MDGAHRPINTDMPTKGEWAVIARRRIPVVELLGLVVNELRTELAGAAWTHGWIGFGSDQARYEWEDGLSMAEVPRDGLPAS